MVLRLEQVSKDPKVPRQVSNPQIGTVMGQPWAIFNPACCCIPVI